jgi:DNA-binding NtrC family response regulator
MDSKTILVVDDEQTIRLLLNRVLKDEGVRVITTDSVTSAERVLEYNQVDLIISDHQMPGEKGLSFLHRVKKDHPQILRVLLTGHADLQVALGAINTAQVHYLLTKPFEVEELRGIIFDLLEWKAKRGQMPARPFTKQRHLLLSQLEAQGTRRLRSDGVSVIALRDLGEYLKVPPELDGDQRHAARELDPVTIDAELGLKSADEDDLYFDEQFLKLLDL